MDKSSLIYPMFIVEGTNIKEEIPSMMGQYRYSVDRMGEKLEELTKAGIGGVMLFGIPNHKDELGSGAYAQDGIVQQGFRKAKELFPDLYMIGDVCGTDLVFDDTINLPNTTSNAKKGEYNTERETGFLTDIIKIQSVISIIMLMVIFLSLKTKF